LTSAEAMSISRRYFEESRTAKSSHNVKSLESIESGALFDTSKARQERILQYGDSISSSEEKAANDQIQVTVPRGETPPGEGRWLLTTGRQSLSGKSRESVGILRQKSGEANWKMTFLAFTPTGKALPKIAGISTKNDSNEASNTSIDFGQDICQGFARFLNNEPTTTINWGAHATALKNLTEQGRKDAEHVTSGGRVSLKAEIPDGAEMPSWRTGSGDRLVMCTTNTISTLTPGPSASITITKNEAFENLNARTTKWKSLKLVKTGMTVLRVPATANSPVDIVADAYRALSSSGSPA